MTKEEIIKYLNIIKAFFLGSEHQPISDAYFALDEAIKALEQESCEDCISRQAVLDYIRDNYRRWFINDDAFMQCMNGIKDIMISVNPQPKTGHWIKTREAVMGEGYMWFCSNCKHRVYQDSSRPYPSENYCPNCGSKMEREDKE